MSHFWLNNGFCHITDFDRTHVFAVVDELLARVKRVEKGFGVTGSFLGRERGQRSQCIRAVALLVIPRPRYDPIAAGHRVSGYAREMIYRRAAGPSRARSRLCM
jgi:hypothetical protein